MVALLGMIGFSKANCDGSNGIHYVSPDMILLLNFKCWVEFLAMSLVKSFL